ncbi:DMSO/TMAO reductase YedYZ molybdopterin-dependent catalytic subunit [Nocardioides ginsengisegetis]|uniref:DMSO/TMAO reductase YedYZ molybdopterin-dependent catalytic subunit n=1 Tax=Nocardioides ginsengisegetis TaxID=661491 RepID=A0A7W3J1N0_9ACTN|nr:sulfite oxidase [Nocardioides ginsengisegetis]MBA8804489.1 DMSO/TMAO reductase YedYZ molybdopterin-dependent catalytic subunit [Nocardioides ginsengisegetis]
MLRDRWDRPVDGGSWFVHHGEDSFGDAESRWEADVPRVTPNDRFFVRNHTRPPVIDEGAWRLLVSGDGVVGDTTYSLADLKAFTSTTYERAVECTGNGRSLFGTQQGTPTPGTPWELGAIGVARWTGVPLRTVLRHAGLRGDAVQVMPVGLDAPYVEDGINHGRVRRPLPIGKALDDTIIAWEMNGEPLPPDHGFPARLVVPGWVGIASIKWLGELRVTTSVVDSPWNTRWYRMHGDDWSGDHAVLDRMPPKSVVDVTGEPSVGHLTLLRGRAWSGEASIRMVEVSTDGGESWDEAHLTGPNEPSSWVEWEHPWTPTGVGPATLMTRATDSLGRVQPLEAPLNDDGYLFGAVVRRVVTVTSEVRRRTPA